MYNTLHNLWKYLGFYSKQNLGFCHQNDHFFQVLFYKRTSYIIMHYKRTKEEGNNEKVGILVGKLVSCSNGLVIKALDSQSSGPVFKTTGWLQGRLSL